MLRSLHTPSSGFPLISLCKRQLLMTPACHTLHPRDPRRKLHPKDPRRQPPHSQTDDPNQARHMEKEMSSVATKVIEK